MGVHPYEWYNDYRNYSDISDIISPDTPSIQDPIGIYCLPPVFLHLIAALDALIFVIGIVGNTIACIVIVCSKSMHTPTNCYLFSLSMSDVLMLITNAPHEIYEIYNPTSFYAGMFGCIVRTWASEVSINVSVITITAFTFERYLAICRPFLAHAMSELSRVKRLIMIIWLVAAVLSIPMAAQHRYEENEGVKTCEFDERVIPYSLEVATAFLFIIPMSVITVMYIMIGMQLTRGVRMEGSGLKEARIHMRVDKSTKRTVKMLVIIVLAFFFCWAPFHAQRLMTEHYNDLGEDQDIAMAYNKIYCIITHVSGIMYLLSAVVNPVIYSIMSSKFREAFEDLLFRRFKSVCQANYKVWKKTEGDCDTTNFSGDNFSISTCI